MRKRAWRAETLPPRAQGQVRGLNEGDQGEAFGAEEGLEKGPGDRPDVGETGGYGDTEEGRSRSRWEHHLAHAKSGVSKHPSGRAFRCEVQGMAPKALLGADSSHH